jgi:serine/threonine protein phosphatase PrpC
MDLMLKSKDAIEEQIKYKEETTGETGLKKESLMAGCTAVVVVVSPDKIIVANAGDSRAVLYRDGKT